MAEKSGQAPEVTSEEALAFIRKMQKAFPKTPRTKAEKARLQKYLARFTDERLKAVGRRVQADVLQRPPRTITPKEVSASKSVEARRSRRAAHRPRRAGRVRR
jgi:hypothetical protein